MTKQPISQTTKALDALTAQAQELEMGYGADPTGLTPVAQTTCPRIEYQWGNVGLIYATSPDVRGLLVAGTTLAEVICKVPLALAELEEANAE